jgi:uncharacterized protein (TIGR04255 family)
MIEANQHQLENPPIIEAVIGFDCMMLPTFDLESIDISEEGELVRDYPQHRKQFVHQSQIKHDGENPPEVKNNTGMEALQMISADNHQLLQFRKGGFSFNRLAPYSSLDNYIRDIESGWRIFCKLIKPESVRKVSLRYINRLPLPMEKGGHLDLSKFLKNPPQVPGDSGMAFQNFSHQYQAIEQSTSNMVNIVLASERAEGEHLPIILDITVFRDVEIQSENFEQLHEVLESLRDLKNRVFHNSITKECRQLFN